MGLWDKLRQATNYAQKLRLSLGPDSYFQYKRERNYQRKQVEHAHDHVRDSAQRERETAAREREYDERYAREREGDIAQKRTEQADRVEPDR